MHTALIFDFNGTLFWDTHLHNQAWDAFLRQHGFALSDTDKNRLLHGKQNQQIFRELFAEPLSDDAITRYTLEKETLYQQLCLETGMTLGPGVVEFLDYLQQERYPFTIATSSGLENVAFFFEHYALDRWFSLDGIVYNNGKIPSKPAPDIFAVAMKKLGCSPEQAIIFEDSLAGIRAAEAAQAGTIVIVNSTGEDYSSFGHPVITHFDQFARHTLQKSQ